MKLNQFKRLLACGLFAVHAFIARPAQAAVTEAWVQRYGVVVSNANDQAFKVVRDAAGDIIVTGTTDDFITGQDMLTIKYSGADGSVLWQKRYNGPVNGGDQATALAVDGSGNVVVTGFSDASVTGFPDDSGNGNDYYTAKYAAADGALLWEKRYNGSANGQDYATAVAVDGSGNVVVTGTSYNENSSYAPYTAKYAAADGALLWETNSGGMAVAVDSSDNVVVTGSSTIKYLANGTCVWTNNSGGAALAVDGGGNVVVTGSSYNTNFNSDFYTAKYAAANGALLWEQRYDGPANNNDLAQAVAVDGNGNVVVTGYSNNTNFNYDYYTAKYAAANGALLWEQRYNGPANSNDEVQAVAVDGNGNVVVTGTSYNANFSIPDYYTAKYAAANGALLWEKRYNSPANSRDQAWAVVVDGSGNVVVTGYSYNANFTNPDYYTAKYEAANGALLWEKRYSGPANNSEQANAVAVDGSGNVVVTGVSYNTNFNYDYYTAKYAPAIGALLWEKRYNGPANRDDFAHAIAVDGSGNVVVTGASTAGNSLPDYYTAKYAATNGAPLWEKRYNGPANGYDQATAVAVDGSGNVVVTGVSATSANSDYYTAKYAGANGALLWEKRYNGPANGGDSATAMAVDGSGNVVVTGVSDNFVGSHDYYTAKYAAANGALLWEKRYVGPGTFDDAKAVAVDGSGNVVVTGASDNSSNIRDYYTAKYAAADGTLLWEKRYNGSANGQDYATAVAVDGSGNVVVTGYSYNGDPFIAGNTDYYTAKYAAADGALLWEKRYNGPANGYDQATAVAVDGSGNVLVTGVSDTSANSSDYYTAKYAGANGALLWEKRYNWGNSYDGASAVAVGPSGVVAITGSSFGDYATVVYRETLPPVSIAEDGTGGYFIRGSGSAGSIYQLQRAPDPFGLWETVFMQAAPPSGLIEYNDTNPLPSQSFYRAVQP